MLWENHLKSCDLFSFIQDGTSRDRGEIVRSVLSKCKFSQRDELLLEHFVLQDAEEEEWVGNESGCRTLWEPRRDFWIGFMLFIRTLHLFESRLSNWMSLWHPLIDWGVGQYIFLVIFPKKTSVMSLRRYGIRDTSTFLLSPPLILAEILQIITTCGSTFKE